MSIVVPAVGDKATAAWADAVAQLLNAFLAVQSDTGASTFDSGNGTQDYTITFPDAFPSTPIVIPYSRDTEKFTVAAHDVDADGFVLTINYGGVGDTVGADHLVNWGYVAFGDGSIVGTPGTEHEVPAGGDAGQVLAKASDTDYDLEWSDVSDLLATGSVVAIGDGATAAGAVATAVGPDATASGNDSTALGQAATTADSSSVAIGVGSNVFAGGIGAVAIGPSASTNAEQSVVLGSNAEIVGGDNAVAVGFQTSVTAAGGVAIGADDTGTGASATTTNAFVLGTALHEYAFPGVKAGFFGVTPAPQPSTPVTLGDVIAALQALGLVA